MTENHSQHIEIVQWYLEDTGYMPPGIAHGFGVSPEVTFEDDNRIVVDLKDITKGGKFEAIVKIFIAFRKPDGKLRWKCATGFLIQKGLLVTNGHCVCDPEEPLEALRYAVQLKAYIHYIGKASVTEAESNVEFRPGYQVVAPSAWTHDWAWAHDVAFVKLKTPFDDVQPFSYRATPETGKGDIGVVGYPMDKKYGKDKGAQPYQQFKVDQDLGCGLDTNDMLMHFVSTYKGQSGSPVLLRNSDDSHDVIGVHCGGKPGVANFASPIAGVYGNFFDAYVEANNGVGVHFDRTVGGISYLRMDVKKEELHEIEANRNVAKEIQASAHSLSIYAGELGRSADVDPDDERVKRAKTLMAQAELLLSAARNESIAGACLDY